MISSKKGVALASHGDVAIFIIVVIQILVRDRRDRRSLRESQATPAAPLPTRLAPPLAACPARVLPFFAHLFRDYTSEKVVSLRTRLAVRLPPLGLSGNPENEKAAPLGAALSTNGKPSPFISVWLARFQLIRMSTKWKLSAAFVNSRINRHFRIIMQFHFPFSIGI